jgi:rhodanese-related sulfurtransferase
MLTELTTFPEAGVEATAARPAESVLLDVREPEEYAAGHVPGAVNLPQSELASRLDELQRQVPIYVVCQGGMRSRRAAQFLRQMDFTDVVNVAGGTSAWVQAGKAVERHAGQVTGRRIVETEWAHAGVGGADQH